MNSTSKKPAGIASTWDQRAIACAVSIAVALAFAFVYAGPSWDSLLYRLLTDGIVVLLWLIAATGIGMPFLALMLGSDKTRSGLFSLVTSTALGLGVMSLAMLGLGLAGWINHATAVALIAIGLALIPYHLWRRRAWLHANFAREVKAPAQWNWLWLAAMPLLGITVVSALMPPGMLWRDEPNGYDVLEYHLQVPREWYDAGRITPLEHNVFSYFPFNVEMHYLLAMELRGGPWDGMYLAQFMHVAMCALAAAAVCGAAGGGKRGALAGVAVATTPWVALVAPVAYVEGGVMLYGALALAWTLRAVESRGVRPMIVAGVMAGFACGVKLTDVPLLLLAIPIALAVASRFWSPFPVRRERVRERGKYLLLQTAVFFLAGLIVFSPWLARNWIWARNPVFPEAMNLLGRAHFSPVEVERWRQAYLPKTGRLGALGSQVIYDWRYGFVLLPIALIAAALAPPRAAFLFTILAILAVVWLGFTHLQGRFFILAIPIAGLLIAEVELRAWPWTVIACIAIMVTIGWISLDQRVMHYLEMDQKVAAGGGIGLLGRENLTGIRPVDPSSLPSTTRIDLVGDVSPFWYQLPSSRLGYRTVFDVDTTDPKRSVVEDWLAAPATPKANRIIIVDPVELGRLNGTYYAIPPLSEEELRQLAARRDVKISGLTPEH